MTGLAAWLMPVVAAAIAGSAGYLAGQHDGHAQGVAAERGRQDAQALSDLRTLIDAHRGLVAQSVAAGRAMRQAQAERARRDAQTTKEFKDALAATAGQRAGCMFGADLMRQLTEAHDRAAQAAATGLRGALPGPADAAEPGR